EDLGSLVWPDCVQQAVDISKILGPEPFWVSAQLVRIHTIVEFVRFGAQQSRWACNICLGVWSAVERTQSHQTAVDQAEFGSFCGRDGMFAVGWYSGGANRSSDARCRNCSRCKEVDTGPVVRWNVGLIKR